jgi:hypothetical protein
MAGRKKDSIWMYFTEEPTTSGKGVKARCKTCQKVIMGLVLRMKKHVDQCSPKNADVDGTLNIQPDASTKENNPTTAKSLSPLQLQASSSVVTTSISIKRKACEIDAVKNGMNAYIIKTNHYQKQILDEHVARYIFATNSAFHHVKHPKFKDMISAMRPGYKAPNEVQIGGVLLNNIYQQEKGNCSEILNGQTVNLSIDGWSNVHNEPVLCTVITSSTGENYLVDTIDTSGHPHTSVYLAEVTRNSLKKCEEEFKCVVRSLVTDNAANVKGMRAQLETEQDLNLITYGCSAHLLNLLAEDINIANVKEQIVYIMKYFRNNHLAGAKYKEAGGSALTLPQEVRWNTMADCLSAYIKNWPILVKVCEENRSDIDIQ